MPAEATMTPDELIATLQRSSLPTVLVEGPDDVIVFRELEQIYATFTLSVLPVGGRSTVLKVFERRHEITNSKILFIADRDFWCLSTVPTIYQHSDLIFTNGYSIENDLYLDYDFNRLLTPAERDIFSAELRKFIFWYALVCSRKMSDENTTIDTHPNNILSTDATFGAHCCLRDSEIYPEALQKQIEENYKCLVRGKSLIGLLLRQLSNAKRNPKHSANGLLEIAAAQRGKRLQSIFDLVGNRLSFTA